MQTYINSDYSSLTAFT